MANFKNNFKNGVTSLTCPLCKDPNSVDSESHSLKCAEINTLIPEVDVTKMENMYSNNIDLLKKTVNIFMKIMNVRENILCNN